MKIKKLIELSFKPLKLREILKRTYWNWHKKKLWLLLDKTIEEKAKYHDK